MLATNYRIPSKQICDSNITYLLMFAPDGYILSDSTVLMRNENLEMPGSPNSTTTSIMQINTARAAYYIKPVYRTLLIKL